MNHLDKENIPSINTCSYQDIEEHETFMTLAGYLGDSIRRNSPLDLQVGTAFCNFGNFCSRMGMLPEALAMYEMDIKITGLGLKDDDPRVVGSKYNYGLALCKLGRYSEAQ